MTESKLSIASFQPEVWTSSANDALQIFITKADGSAVNAHPIFTYPIFGDSEQIFGYKDLIMYLCFDSFTFYPFFNLKYSEKLNDENIDDPKTKMLSFLPESTVFKDEEEWQKKIEEEKKCYKIPGEQIMTASNDQNGVYAIYKVDLRTDAGLELHKRLQILVLLFIEAGSYIDIDDNLWDLYVIYDVTSSESPDIVGFCTAYNYWKYPGSEKFDSNLQQIRKKISQFIILPNFQGKGLGGIFYSQLYEYWFKDNSIVEIVVEDPNEAFDDLRDRCDLQRLSKELFIDEIDIALVNSPWAESTRKAQKMEKRQFARCLEMILLYLLRDNLKSLSKKEIRLFIKKRLYLKNREVLEPLDEAMKKDKLQTAYASLEEDYYRILGDMVLSKSSPDHAKKKIKV